MSEAPAAVPENGRDVDTPADRTRSRRFRADELSEQAPGLLAIGALLVLAAVDGGFRQTISHPVGLFLAGLLVVILLVRRPRLGSLGRPAAIGLGLLAAYTTWSFASIGWADVQGVAFEAADRTLIYLLIFALFALIPWRPQTAVAALATYAIGIGVIGGWVILSVAGAEDAALSFVNGRFADPTGYVNSTAALFAGAFWPAVFLASRSYVAWPVRGLLLAVAAFSLQLALLPQSRGAVYVFPIAALVFLIVSPLRGRALIALLLTLAATGLASGPILDVYEVAEYGGDLGEALAAARDAMALSFVALLLIGTGLAYADSRLPASAVVSRYSRKALAAIAIIAAVAGIGFAAANDPIGWSGDRWDDFKGGYDSEGFGDSRFSGDLGSGRYDFWRVALTEQFARSPIVGTGADNFATDYIANRRSGEEPLYTHSLPLRVLGGTGIVGALLLGGAFAAFLVGVVRLRVASEGDPVSRGVAAVALSGFAYWLLHSSGDWLWTFTGVTGWVFALLGIATALSFRPGKQDGATPAPRRRPALIAAAAAVAVVVAVALVPAWLSEREVDAAASSWGENAEAAYDRLERARGLNPFSSRPDLVAGAIATARGELDRARHAFGAATERDPLNWYAQLQLGTIMVYEGDVRPGLAHVRRAAELNPEDPVIADVLRYSRSNEPVTPSEVDERLLAEACAVVGPTRETEFCK